ncbi:alpha/beta hydrolase [Nocardioides sp. URHA0020]|uniref:alpha/beta hydrolase n=1 Tax=Nocardioides sp. URHA0020 TaxID=1380392 RepID=UPI000686E581|nr:alpha/beta-hydrolase family protein [Nocardioides sp. URHA0020]
MTWRAPIAATVGAVLLFWLSLTPSLLPLGPVFQGVVSAVCALLGYGVGALLGWMLRASGVRLDGPRRQRTWQVVAAVAGVGTVVALVLGHRWDDQVRDLVGVDRDSLAADLLQLAVTAVLFVALLGISRLLRSVGRGVGRQVGRVLPDRVALVIGALVVAWVAWGLVTGVLGGRVVGALDATFQAIDDEFRTDTPAPTSPYVSAGPRSGESWDDLGRQGRVFIASAPTSDEIGDFTGGDAQQPVRAYVGASGDVDLTAEARRAVGELERTGGFDRAVLNVVTGTGRGWVNENQARALEYMWAGDTATVSMQYSYLPSWMSFLADGERAQDAGRILFDAVYAHWVALPADRRPLLVVSGESLGSFGGEAAFSGAQDLATRTDGALFVGPTANNRLWSRFTAERDAGTPEVLPTYAGGDIVRFADQPSDWDAPGEWSGTRIGYLQHANDPITWWDLGLALQRPDWLSEPRGRDVSPRVRWVPVVTMLQLAADQMVANGVPAGQGHQFGQEPVRAWAEILPPAGWTDADTERLAVRIGELEPDVIG